MNIFLNKASVLTLLYHGEKKAVRFIADDQAHFVSRLGLALDATPALGGTRAKVYTFRPLGLQISFPSHVPIYFWVCFRNSALSLSPRMTPSRP